MYLIRLWRFLRGYVKFIARSGSVERFLNLCAHHRIPTWDCRRMDDALTGCTTAEGYRRIRPLARKAGVHPRITERHGAPFLVHRYRRRMGIAVGALLLAALLLGSQQFVWVIRVEGCQRTTQEQMKNALGELGVRRGSLKGKIDARDIEQKLLVRVNDLAWASLNVRGTTATLLLRERVQPPAKIDTNVPANVVADRDGQIKRMEVTDGQPLLKVGDTVRAGDIIVSGVRQDRWGLTHLVRANARVMAHVPQTLEVKIPLEQQTAVLTGETRRRRYLELGGIRLPLFLYHGIEGEYKVERLSRPAQVFGVELPFEISRETYIFYEQQQETLSPETALRFAERQLERRERDAFGESVVSRQVSACTEDGALVLRGEYLVETDIARQVDIPVLDRREQERARPPREGGY